MFQSVFGAGLELGHLGRPCLLGVGLDPIDLRRDAVFCFLFDFGEFCLECARFAFGRQACLFVRLFSQAFRLRLNLGHLGGVLLGRLRSRTLEFGGKSPFGFFSHTCELDTLTFSGFAPSLGELVGHLLFSLLFDSGQLCGQGFGGLRLCLGLSSNVRDLSDLGVGRHVVFGQENRRRRLVRSPLIRLVLDFV